MFKVIGEVLLDLLFPKFCCGCSKMDTYLCGSCFNEVDLLSMPIKLSLEPQYITQITAVAYYERIIRSLIHTYKYEFVQGIGKSLAQFIYYTTQIPTTDYITAVPLHPQRAQERGFNQSALVAQELSKLTGTEYIELLERTSFTMPQASITDKQKRLTNITNHFKISNDLILTKITGKTVLIIDDVSTTGATLNECARILVSAGVSAVEGLVIAHGG